MKKTVEAWIEFADTDLLAVSEILGRPELTNIVAFHCQQAIEKYGASGIMVVKSKSRVLTLTELVYLGEAFRLKKNLNLILNVLRQQF